MNDKRNRSSHNEATAFLRSSENGHKTSENFKVIRATCPNCQKQYKLSREKAGKRVRCKNCETLFSLPGGKRQRNNPRPSIAQEGSVSHSEDSDLKKIGAVVILIISLGIGTYRLIIRPIMDGSRYSEAERLTTEVIQEMNEMADLAEGTDFTKEMSPELQRRIDESSAKMEAKAKRLFSLKLSSPDRLKLKQKHGPALKRAKTRFEQAMMKQLKRAFSQTNRRK